MRRFGFILACMTVLLVAGAAFSQVGHITPVGHVDSVDLGKWGEPTDEEVQVNPETTWVPLQKGQAPQNTDQLGTLQLPQDRAYVLTLLGGIECSRSRDLVPTSSASAQETLVELQVEDPLVISGDLKLQGQNMLLLYNNVTKKWDGYPDSIFNVEEGSSYDLLDSPDKMQIRVIGAKATEVTSGGSGGGGGCTAAFLSPAALFLVAPLFLLKRRG